MCKILRILPFIVSLELASCSVGGLTYRDDLILDPSRKGMLPDNPCNPLYWYPRETPEFCYQSPPAPLPPPPPPPPPPLLPAPPPLMHMPPSMMMPIPAPPMLMPAPYPVPYPAPMAPPPAYPYPLQAGMVPGLPGIVSPEGGINILPFSDAYSDLLEKHKQKMIRIRLQELLDKYDGNPKRSRRRKYRRRRYHYSE